jgi:endonuclease YncB( thermonuclease family)
MIGFRRGTLLAGLVLLAGCAAVPTTQADAPGRAAGPDPATLRRVVSAYDGDTIRVRGEARLVRLAGYDTPERTDRRCKLEKELALEARAKLLELTGNGVALERARDPKGRLQRDVDRYGRLLRAGTLPDRRDLATAMREARSRDGLPLAVENWGERRTHDWCKVGARRWAEHRKR